MPAPARQDRPLGAPRSAPRPEAGARIAAKAARTMLLRTAALAVLFAALAALVTYLVDPLQFYHKPFGYRPFFSSEQRYQNPGLALHYDYDTIIVGTSMTENFLPSEVGRALGGHALKLSIRGSTADEQYKIAKLAIDTGKVKQVLWGLDYFALKNGDQEAAGPFPDYLYDGSRWNDYRYLLNYSVYGPFFKEIAKTLTGSGPQSLETLYNWNGSVRFGKAAVLQDYRSAQQEETYFGLNEEPLEVIRRNFDERVLSLVQAHPEVRFTFYYPPYSVLREAVWAQTNETRYRNQLDMAVWMFQRFDALPNARVYDFRTAGEWTYDLDLYKDISHHSQAVNSAIAAAIGKDDPRFRMTAANAQSFSAELAEQVRTLALTPAGDPVSASVAVVAGSDAGEGLAAMAAAPGQDAFTSRIVPGDGEMLVPAKEAAAALGATFDWNQAAKTLVVARGGKRVELTLDRAEAVADGRPAELPYPARLAGGRTHVPIVRLAELLGLGVRTERPNAWSVRYVVEAGGAE